MVLDTHADEAAGGSAEGGSLVPVAALRHSRPAKYRAVSTFVTSGSSPRDMIRASCRLQRPSSHAATRPGTITTRSRPLPNVNHSTGRTHCSSLITRPPPYVVAPVVSDGDPRSPRGQGPAARQPTADTRPGLGSNGTAAAPRHAGNPRPQPPPTVLGDRTMPATPHSLLRTAVASARGSPRVTRLRRLLGGPAPSRRAPLGAIWCMALSLRVPLTAQAAT